MVNSFLFNLLINLHRIDMRCPMTTLQTLLFLQLKIILYKELSPNPVKTKKNFFKTMSQRLISYKDALILQKLNRNNNPTHLVFQIAQAKICWMLAAKMESVLQIPSVPYEAVTEIFVYAEEILSRTSTTLNACPVSMNICFRLGWGWLDLCHSVSLAFTENAKNKTINK